MTRRTTDGVLLVDKPEALTSHDVVAIARRVLGTARVGHTGTLDPFATGLLVLLVGRATRLAQYVEGEPKQYRACIRFGEETDSDDRTGTVTRSGPLPDPAAVDRGIARLTGELLQQPPAFSAKQVGGRRAYAAARRGQPLALAVAPVTVHEWSIIARAPDRLEVVISCSGGTYIRALARDLGRAAESAAHLSALRRLRSGVFDVADAVTVERLRGGDAALVNVRAALPHMPSRVLNDAERARVLHGMALADPGDGDRIALLDEAGALVAVAEREGARLRPRLVLGND